MSPGDGKFPTRPLRLELLLLVAETNVAALGIEIWLCNMTFLLGRASLCVQMGVKAILERKAKSSKALGLVDLTGLGPANTAAPGIMVSPPPPLLKADPPPLLKAEPELPHLSQHSSVFLAA